MTRTAPTPPGCSAADLLNWWRERARTEPATSGYYAACVQALACLGTPAELASLDARTLDIDLLITAATIRCWTGLPATGQHHEARRLRRAVAMFRAALSEAGTVPVFVNPTRTPLS